MTTKSNILRDVAGTHGEHEPKIFMFHVLTNIQKMNRGELTQRHRPRPLEGFSQSKQKKGNLQGFTEIQESQKQRAAKIALVTLETDLKESKCLLRGGMCLLDKQFLSA